MEILLDDIPYNKTLYPFGAVRSIAHLRIGILTIFEKWQLAFPGKVLIASEQSLVSGSTDSLIRIPANLIPLADLFNQIEQNISPISMDQCLRIDHPWEIFEHNKNAIQEDFLLLTAGRKSAAISDDNGIVCPENIFVESGAKISFSILNATEGPIYIGKNAQILEGSMVRGPFALCEGGRLKMGTKIYGATTIGCYCIAGGEIKNSILMDYSNKAHDGYLGDSVIGRWCNLGAGTSNSNLKNTAGIVKVWNNETREFLEAGIKCGLFMGDYSRCAINTSFNTGTVVGVCCNIFGNTFPSKHVEDFMWGNEAYIFEKALNDIANWKKLKGIDISQDEIESLKNLYSSKNKL